jgi:hypothetical protein
MKKSPKRKLKKIPKTNKKQSERFKESARLLATDVTPESFEDAFRKIVVEKKKAAS